jgi:F-type H+-transporting ATPase subunit b
MENEVQTPGFFAACELKRKVSIALSAALFLLISATAFAQEHAAAAEHGGATHSFGEMLVALAWPMANFVIFCGVLYYFLNGPLKNHLASRSTTIGKELVEAAGLKASATKQLAEIEQKLQALPGEIEAFKKRGAAEIVAEEQRITESSAAERERLLEQTRREIELQVRRAKRELLEHAADLSMQLASERIKKEITPEDQSRIVDRYLELMRAGQAPSGKPNA